MIASRRHQDTITAVFGEEIKCHSVVVTIFIGANVVLKGVGGGASFSCEGHRLTISRTDDKADDASAVKVLIKGLQDWAGNT